MVQPEAERDDKNGKTVSFTEEEISKLKEGLYLLAVEIQALADEL